MSKQNQGRALSRIDQVRDAVPPLFLCSPPGMNMCYGSCCLRRFWILPSVIQVTREEPCLSKTITAARWCVCQAKDMQEGGVCLPRGGDQIQVTLVILPSWPGPFYDTYKKVN